MIFEPVRICFKVKVKRRMFLNDNEVLPQMRIIAFAAQADSICDTHHHMSSETEWFETQSWKCHTELHHKYAINSRPRFSLCVAAGKLLLGVLCPTCLERKRSLSVRVSSLRASKLVQYNSSQSSTRLRYYSRNA